MYQTKALEVSFLYLLFNPKAYVYRIRENITPKRHGI